ncbi:glycosyl transferase [Bacteroidia bacterium]|nr:glycosyl transferase [Bacteroidia bacterium]
MKVLMFGWEFPPHITGGLGTACYGLAKGLLKQGVEVVFVVPKAYGDEDNNVAHIVNASDMEIDLRNKIYQRYWNNLTYIEIGSKLVPYMGFNDYLRLEKKLQVEGENIEDGFYKRKFSFSGKYQSNLMEEVHQYALTAAMIATQYDYDIIHAHDWLCYEAGIAAKAASGKPLVIHVHATEFDRSGENVNQVVYDIERRGMQAADKVMTVSNLTRQIVIERYGVDPAKVFTVYNAVEPITIKKKVEFKKHFPEKVVTFLGRITFQKGPEYFVEAANQVLQQDENVRFVMAGSGDLLYKTVRRVAELGMGSKFHFTGFLKGVDVDRMFLMSDVYVMPSISEPFGISPLEAMRAGVPVVISNQSGASEILKNALKVDFWDVDAMANAIYGLLHYPTLHKHLSVKGVEEVDSLKWENAALSNLKIYHKALSK